MHNETRVYLVYRTVTPHILFEPYEFLLTMYQMEYHFEKSYLLTLFN